MTPVFGDDEPADVYDTGGRPAPEQVARRLHELRSAMHVLTGGAPLPPWHLYDRAALETAAITLAVRDLTLANADTFGRALHDGLAPVAHLPVWEDLTAEGRELGLQLGSLLVAWLLAEGSLR